MPMEVKDSGSRNEFHVELHAPKYWFVSRMDAMIKCSGFRISPVEVEEIVMQCDAGYYVTRILSMKTSRGMEICICDGRMNYNLAACGLMGMVIPRNYRFFKIGESERTGEVRLYQLVGPLCTSIDTLGRQVELPSLIVGDLIGMRTAGAYGATASPVHFISHLLPQEVIVSSIGTEAKFEVRQLR